MKKCQHKYSEFGLQAKLAMVKLGISNRELARQLGYTESTLCDVLKGRNGSERRKQEINDALKSAEKDREPYTENPSHINVLSGITAG